MTTQTTNIRYNSDGIVRWLDGFRDKWEDFYPSEKWAFEKLAGPAKVMGSILDVGCAMGGLGLALTNRYEVASYTGVDINRPALERALARKKEFPVPAQFICDDILKVTDLPQEAYDIVFSLSCADWNIETHKIMSRCWEYLKPGGSFVISLRLTDKEGINDFSRSHQSIAVDEQGKAVESANYVVFNWLEFLRLVKGLTPSPVRVSGYGYWGKPSSNAVTPYDRLVFGVMIVQKAEASDAGTEPVMDLNLPLTLVT